MAGFQYEPYENRSLGSILDLMTRGPHAQAEAARASAAAHARAMEIRGQNTSQLVGTLGQIASGVTNQIGHYYSPEAKLQRTQVEEQQRSIAEDHALRQLFADGQPTANAIYQVVGPKRGVDIVKGLAALSEQNIKTDDAVVGKIADLTAGVLAWPEAGRPQAYQAARQHLVQLGISPEQIPEQYSETFVRQAQQAALTSKDRMAQAAQAARDAETARHNGVMEDRPIAVGAGTTLYAPKERTPLFTAPKVETPVSLQAKDALLDGKPASLTFNPRTGRYLDASGQDVSANVKPMPPAATRVQLNAGPQEGALSPEGLDYAATQYRLTGVMPALGMGKNADRGKIINTAAAQAKALGQSPAAAIQKQAARKADSASLTQITKMKGAAESFESKALAQADKVVELSNAVGRSSWPLVNAAILAGKTEIAGNSQATQLLNAVGTFTAEYAKIVEGSTGSAAGSSDSARRMTERLLNPKMNKGTVADVVKLMKWEMSQTIQGYDATIDHITSRMGGSNLAPASTDTSVPVAPQGGQITVTDPKGGKHTFATQAQADEFKRLAGIK